VLTSILLASLLAAEPKFVTEQLNALEVAHRGRQTPMGNGKDVLADECIALEALGEHADELDAEEVLPLVVRSLEGEWKAQSSARKALEAFGPVARPFVVSALEHGDAALRAGAADTLGLLWPRESVEPLVLALNDRQERVRNSAAFRLTGVALKFEAARAPLIAALGDDEVRYGVTKFRDEYGYELEQKAPEIGRALDALMDADPTVRVARWMFVITLGTGALSLLALITGLLRLRGGTVRQTENELIPTPRKARMRGPLVKIFARTRGVSASYSDSMDIWTMILGLLARDQEAIDFALRALGVLGFVLSGFLAMAFAMLAHGVSAGWGFLMFVGVFFGVIVQQTAISYGNRKKT
jgi:hypothetical protein